MTFPKLCLPTLDPRHGGGVKSATKAVYEVAHQSGYDPYLVYNAVDWDYCQTLGNVLTGNVTPNVVRETIDGMNGRRIGRVLPEVEVGNYVFNQGQWENELSDGSTFLGIGGPCLSSLPLARSNNRFGCWIGTTIEDERNTQRHGFTLAQRVRYRAIRPVLQRFERSVLEEANPVLAQSNYTKQQIIDRHDLNPDEIEVLPVPIDTERFKPPEGNNPEDDYVVTFVGRYSDPRKNVALLIRAFAKLVEEVPSSRLVLVGDDLNESQESLIESLNISNHVESKGRVKDVVPFLRRADVFAIPSNQEGLCIAGLEAMSCGLPVVATRCGGPEDYVTNGETGYLVPRNDTEAFAERLAVLYSDDVQASLSQGARELVLAQYRKEHIAKELKGVIARLAH